MAWHSLDLDFLTALLPIVTILKLIGLLWCSRSLKTIYFLIIHIFFNGNFIQTAILGVFVLCMHIVWCLQVSKWNFLHFLKFSDWLFEDDKSWGYMLNSNVPACLFGFTYHGIIYFTLGFILAIQWPLTFAFKRITI